MAGSARAGPSCCTGNGRRAVLGSSFIILWPPLPGFVFSMLKEKAVAWIRGSTIRSLCVHAYGKIQEDYCVLHGTPSLTIILDTPHGLFNIEYLRSVHSLSTHNVCVLPSHTSHSVASRSFAQGIDALVSPERHTHRPYSGSSLRAGHSTSKNGMTSRCIALIFF